MFETLRSAQGRGEALATLLRWEPMPDIQFLPWQPEHFFRYHRESHDTLAKAQGKYKYVRYLQRAFGPSLELAGWNHGLQRRSTSNLFSKSHHLAQHDADSAFKRSREEIANPVLKTAVASLAASFILFLVDIALFEILPDWHKDFVVHRVTSGAESRTDEGKLLLLFLSIMGCHDPIFQLGCLIFLATDLVSGSNTESPRLAMWKPISAFIPYAYAGLALTLRFRMIWIVPWQSIIRVLSITFDMVPHLFRVLLVAVRFGMVRILNTIDSGKLWTMLLVNWLRTMLKSTYAYEALDPRQQQFRILRLHARSLYGLVECELLTASMAQPPRTYKYEAISYRWPSGWFIYPIVVDGKRFLVPRTVYKILVALQSPGAIRDIWIDSICIHQACTKQTVSTNEDNRGEAKKDDEELTEKNHQLRLMGEIYQGATKVIAWIGDTSDGMGGITFLRNMARSIGDLTTFFGTGALAVIGLGPRGIYTWRKVIELFCIEYFTRIWMIQEIALAREVVLKHGAEEMCWSEFSECLAFIFQPTGERFFHTPSLIRGWTVNDTAWLGIKNAVLMDMFRRNMSRQQIGSDELRQMSPVTRELAAVMCKPLDADGLRRLPLESLLGFTTDFHATNVKDKIYAVLGMAQKSTGQFIKPQYDDEKETAAEAIRHAARVALASPDETLEHFHLAGCGYDETSTSKSTSTRSLGQRIGSWLKYPSTKKIAMVELKLPSWVPEWDMCFHRKPVVEGFLYTAGIADNSIMKKIETVNGRPDLIRMSASKLSKVEKIGEFFQFASKKGLNRADFPKNFRNFWDNALQLTKDIPMGTYGSSNIEDNLWRTIFGDSLSNSTSLKSDDLEQMKSVTKALAGLEQPTLPQDILEYGEDTLFELGRTLFGHRLCVTDWGYIGLVPPATRIGDIVCIIWGSATPFVIRSSDRYEELMVGVYESNDDGGKKEDDLDNELEDERCAKEYVLIGSCYVHGLMRGEISPEVFKPSMMTLK